MASKTVLPFGIGLGLAITGGVIAFALFGNGEEQNLSQGGDQLLGAASSQEERKPADPANTFQGVITKGQIKVGVLTGKGVYDQG